MGLRRKRAAIAGGSLVAAAGLSVALVLPGVAVPPLRAEAVPAPLTAASQPRR
jgi:hypothetical protein